MTGDGGGGVHDERVIGPDEDPVAALNRHAGNHPFVTDLGVTVESIEDGVIRARIPHNEDYANPGMDGALHGGVVTAMLDTVMGFAVTAATADDPTAAVGPTINMNVNFLGAVADEVVGVAEVVRVGASTAVIDGELRDPESGAVLASSEGVWRIYSDRD